MDKKSIGTKGKIIPRIGYQSQSVIRPLGMPVS